MSGRRHPDVILRALRSGICPLAPFLIPTRTLRANASMIRGYSDYWDNRPSRSDYASRSLIDPSRRFPRRSKGVENAYRRPRASTANGRYDTSSFDDPELAKIQDAYHLILDEKPVPEIHSLNRIYPEVVASGLMHKEHLLMFIEALHGIYTKYRYDKDVKEEIAVSATYVVKDLQSYRVPLSEKIVGRLLLLKGHLGKIESAQRLWAWLEKSHSEFVTQRTTGIMMEVLNRRGAASFQELEAMYSRAMKQNPGGFAEYHLSPHAVLPDIHQPVDVRDIPVTLFQGMVSTWVRHTMWQPAYVSLDTILRLYPTQTPFGFFEVLMDHRSFPEAFKIFMIACRSGIVLKEKCLSRQITRQERLLNLPTIDAFDYRVTVVSRLVSLLTAYASIGGTLNDVHICLLLRAIRKLLPNRTLLKLSAEYRADFSQATDATIDLVRHLVSTLKHAGHATGPKSLTALINFATDTRRPEVIGSYLDHAQRLQGELDSNTTKMFMWAYALAGDYEKAASFEKKTIRRAQAEGVALTDRVLDWRKRARWELSTHAAAARNEQESRIDESDHMISTADLINEAQSTTPPETSPHYWNAERSKLEQQQLKEQLRLSDAAHATLRLDIDKLGTIMALQTAGGIMPSFDELDVPMDLTPAKGRLRIGTDAASRQLFEQMSQGTSRSSDDTSPRRDTAASSTIATSQTGDSLSGHQTRTPMLLHDLHARPRSRTDIPLGELRYRNWCTVNELLVECQLSDRARALALESQPPLSYDEAKAGKVDEAATETKFRGREEMSAVEADALDRAWYYGCEGEHAQEPLTGVNGEVLGTARELRDVDDVERLRGIVMGLRGLSDGREPLQSAARFEPAAAEAADQESGDGEEVKVG